MEQESVCLNESYQEGVQHASIDPNKIISSAVSGVSQVPAPPTAGEPQRRVSGPAVVRAAGDSSVGAHDFVDRSRSCRIDRSIDRIDWGQALRAPQQTAAISSAGACAIPPIQINRAAHQTAPRRCPNHGRSSGFRAPNSVDTTPTLARTLSNRPLPLQTDVQFIDWAFPLGL